MSGFISLALSFYEPPAEDGGALEGLLNTTIPYTMDDTNSTMNYLSSTMSFNNSVLNYTNSTMNNTDSTSTLPPQGYSSDRKKKLVTVIIITTVLIG